MLCCRKPPEACPDPVGLATCEDSVVRSPLHLHPNNSLTVGEWPSWFALSWLVVGSRDWMSCCIIPGSGVPCDCAVRNPYFPACLGRTGWSVSATDHGQQKCKWIPLNWIYKIQSNMKFSIILSRVTILSSINRFSSHCFYPLSTVTLNINIVDIDRDLYNGQWIQAVTVDNGLKQ